MPTLTTGAHHLVLIVMVPCHGYHAALFADVGVAATLAAGLHVAGHNVVRMTPLGTLRMLTIITNRARKPKATKG